MSTRNVIDHLTRPQEVLLLPVLSVLYPEVQGSADGLDGLTINIPENPTCVRRRRGGRTTSLQGMGKVIFLILIER